MFSDDISIDFAEAICNSDNIDTLVEDYYFGTDTHYIDIVMNRCDKAKCLRDYQNLFLQITDTYSRQQYHLACIGLFAIADGLMADISTMKKSTSFEKRIKSIEQKMADKIELDTIDRRTFFIHLQFDSLGDNLSNSVFGFSDFTRDEPNELNRHLMYFERLLDDAHNELVRQAEAEGDLAIGYTCFHAPEVLLNLGSCFSVRLRAPHTTSMELATYYMANNSCEFSRAILERALEGNYGFLHAMAGVDVCEANNRAIENMEIMHAQGADKDKFFYCNLDIPYSDDEDCVEHICEQVSRKILKPMRENYGVDTSDAAIRAAVSEHNEVCRILTEIGETRKLDNPPITGYEYAVLVLVSYVCPKRLILPLLRETLAEVKAREVDAQKNYRVRVAVVGSEIDDPDLIRLIESCGALVVADRYCYGSFPGRQEIVLTDGEDALTQVCRWYLQHTECPRQSALHRVQYRNDHVAQLVHDFKADGAIYEQMKFCTYWSYERVIANQVMPRDYGIHILSIDRPYIAGQSGQLRTRVQAFVESLEMKQLRSAQKEDN